MDKVDSEQLVFDPADIEAITTEIQTQFNGIDADWENTEVALKTFAEEVGEEFFKFKAQIAMTMEKHGTDFHSACLAGLLMEFFKMKVLVRDNSGVLLDMLSTILDHADDNLKREMIKKFHPSLPQDVLET